MKIARRFVFIIFNFNIILIQISRLAPETWYLWIWPKVFDGYERFLINNRIQFILLKPICIFIWCYLILFKINWRNYPVGSFYCFIGCLGFEYLLFLLILSFSFCPILFFDKHIFNSKFIWFDVFGIYSSKVTIFGCRLHGSSKIRFLLFNQSTNSSDWLLVCSGCPVSCKMHKCLRWPTCFSGLLCLGNDIAISRRSVTTNGPTIYQILASMS